MTGHRLPNCLFWSLLGAVFTQACVAAEPKILSVVKIWDQAPHNAFTDLIRWHDHWFCTFREGEGHVGGDGRIRVLVSKDGTSWESAALISEAGIDLRDPKLSITPDDRLMIVAGGSQYEGKTLRGMQPRVSFSSDGRQWSAPQRILTQGEWLWRVTWFGGRCYGVAYQPISLFPPAPQSGDQQNAAQSNPGDWKLRLVVSDNGQDFRELTSLSVPGRPNETTLRFLPHGEVVALVRRESGNQFGWIGRSLPPYTTWTWKETEHRLGGPNFLRLPDGSLWAAGRSYPGGAKTVLARMSPDGMYQPVLTLPSRGDTSYPGMVWYQGRLWVSYYSSHEGKTSIYLAQIRVPLAAEEIGTRREPFVDDYLIDQLKGSARLVPQRPQPREVVLTADRPWEGNTSAYFTVFRDENLFRMYYRGSHWDEQAKQPTHREVTCYAESQDGLLWIKPNLGLYEFEGSKENNIVWDGPGTHCFTPFKDTNPHESPDARYKALTSVTGGLLALKSADGIRWQPMTDKPVITQGAFDSQNLAFWDPHMRKYREYHRAFRNVRDIMTGISEDFLTWTEPIWLDYPHSPPEHLYTNAVLPYPGAPHILVGFPTRFLPQTQQTEPTLMVSRDGHTFHRYLEALIPLTAPQDRAGNRSNYLAWGLLELPHTPSEWSVYATEAYYAGPATRLRRFTFRRDGLVCLSAQGGTGEVLTRPLRFQGRKLLLNFRTERNGSLRVEVQDPDGIPLPNFTLEDAIPLQGDELTATAMWSQGGDLTSLADKPVQLRFVLDHADLFSMQFE